jgi:toxin CcdB
MAQFDVHHNPASAMADGAPYVVDVQSEQVAGLPTRMIVPLVRLEDGVRAVGRLNPMVAVNGEALALMTHMMAAVPAIVLGRPVASLEDHRTDIIAALDLLFTGL